ncbi:snake venom 5'-nucleotidase-like [Rhipicephalus sanguineus]|uniref:snake venom 5'-nucleotidase-like n=1 Tax=Rhipicephalus sanguineus TaxID=34632 RepID=UPI0020C318BA|nr:snake venom 5'-nucleotidase-like [Rhipicephalus sanguineus]
MAYIFASTNHFQLLSKFQMTVQVRSMSIVSAIVTPIILDLQAPEVYIDNRKDVCQAGECNGGNLLADAAFDYFSEVAVAGAWSQINAVVVNAGSMSTSFDEKTKSGELRLEDVFQMYPYNDQYMFVTMRGTTLQNMMEYSGRRAPPYTKFLQLSGIRVKYKANPGVNESTVSSLLILCTSCRTPTYERVIGIQWYTLAMSRYLANGGDGYDFTRVPRGYKVSSNISDDLIMRHYLKKRSPIMPMLDGRIVFESGAQALGAPYWTRAAFSSLCIVAAMTVATSA